jgi:hypothetical protein
MRFLILTALLLYLSVNGSAKFKNKEFERREFSTIMAGPEAGGSILFMTMEGQGLTTYFHYRYGGFIVVRPVKKVGLESGFRYNSLIGTEQFYEIPLFLQLYGRENSALIIGPNLIYPDQKKDTDFSSPLTGFTLGAGNPYGTIFLSLFPVRGTYFEEKTNFIVSIGISLRVGFIRF